MLKKYKGPQKSAEEVESKDQAGNPAKTKKTDKIDQKLTPSNQKEKNEIKATQNSLNKNTSENQSKQVSNDLNAGEPVESKTPQSKKRVQFEDQQMISVANEVVEVNRPHKENSSIESNLIHPQRNSLTNAWIDKEESFVNPISEMSIQQNINGGGTHINEINIDDQKNNKKILDHVARITIDQEENKPEIFSYHYEYKDYLNYFDLEDVSVYI